MNAFQLESLRNFMPSKFVFYYEKENKHNESTRPPKLNTINLTHNQLLCK